jgi:antitoxin VapB
MNSTYGRAAMRQCCEPNRSSTSKRIFDQVAATLKVRTFLARKLGAQVHHAPWHPGCRSASASASPAHRRETLTEGVINALRERLERELRKDQSIENLIEDVMEIGRHCAALPLLHQPRPDDILGYDKNGLPR